jgi:hypothetical protein
LPGKRRNQNPVEQTKIELNIIFHADFECAQ